VPVIQPLSTLEAFSEEKLALDGTTCRGPLSRLFDV